MIYRMTHYLKPAVKPDNDARRMMMRHLSVLLISGVILALALTGTGLAFERVVLVEEFTNTYCTPCADFAPAFNGFLADHEDNIAVVVTHVWWPVNSDPWYQHATAEASERVDYYGVSGVPSVRIDGQTVSTSSASMNSMYNNRINLASPVEIELIPVVVDGQSVNVTVTVNSGNEAVTGNNYLRVALVETFSSYSAPNGQNAWHYGLHDYLPDAEGTEFSINANSTETYQFDFDWSDRYDDENLMVTAFIQNDTNREVIQAAMSEPIADYFFTVTSPDNNTLCASNSTVNFNVAIANRGLQDDSYQITMNADLLETWTATYTTPEGTQSGNSTMSLTSSESYTSTVSIGTDGTEGASGVLTLTYTSVNQPFLSFELAFFVMNTPRVLVVNGDPEGNYSDFYESAIAYAANTDLDGYLSWGVWPLYQRELDAFDLVGATSELILWYIGDGGDIDNNHVSGLQAYLNQGHSLWISGSAAPQRIDDTQLLTLMGADYQGTYPSGSSVTGVDDDPIGNGLAFNLGGGDGADNLGVPTSMTLVGNGTQSIMYSAIRRAGVRNEGDTGYRTFLLGFPFEAIADADSRNAFMLQALAWLVPDGWVDTPEVDDNTVPQVYNLSQNHPNPFNPTTEIAFTLPAHSQVSVTVFDVMGREVAQLANGTFTAGSHRVTFDGSYLASGVYFYRMTVTGEKSFEATRKMILMK